MKTKKKVLYDNFGSTSQMRAVVREALWGMVEKIARDNTAEEVAEASPVQLEDLPMQFSSNKKRKNGNDGRKSNKKQQISYGLQLPVPKYNGTLLEENVYLIANHELYDGVAVRIFGVGSGQLQQPILGRLIGHIGNGSETSCGKLLLIDRKQLRPIPTSDRNEAHKLVQLDEQRILQEGMPAEVHLKYWDQRYRLMRLYDKGAKLDAESWFSITPEAVAKHVTSSCIGRARELGCKMDKVLDCFSGCGGNTIPFAQLGKTVVSVDFDQRKLDNLRHNCKVYEVAREPSCVCADVYALLEALVAPSQLTSIKDRYDKILSADLAAESEEPAESIEPTEHTKPAKAAEYPTTELEEGSANGVASENSEHESAGKTPATGTDSAADASNINTSAQMIETEQLALCKDADLVILSPPWGGPDYLYADTYCLYTMLTCGCGLYLTMLAAAASPNLLLLLPINTSQQQIRDIASAVQMPFVIEYVHINNSPKVMAVYMGDIVNHAGKHGQKGKAKEAVEHEKEVVPTGKANHVFFDDEF